MLDSGISAEKSLAIASANSQKIDTIIESGYWGGQWVCESVGMSPIF